MVLEGDQSLLRTVLGCPGVSVRPATHVYKAEVSTGTWGPPLKDVTCWDISCGGNRTRGESPAPGTCDHPQGCGAGVPMSPPLQAPILKSRPPASPTHRPQS